MMTVQEELSARAKRELRIVIETYYDIQDIRKATDRRIDQYAEHEGLVAMLGEVDAEKVKMQGPAAYKKAIRENRQTPVFQEAYKAAVDALEDDQHHAKVNKLMSQQEAILKRKAMKHVAQHPLWIEWLASVKGIGPCLAGGLLARIHIEQCQTVSQLWKYAGLAVTMEGWKCHACSHTLPHDPSLLKRGVRAFVICPKCKNPMAAIAHADRRQKGKKLDFNPHLKTLGWKCGESFCKTGVVYRKLYERFREEVERKIALRDGFCHKEHLDEKERVIRCFDAHKYAMAKRLTVKVFFAHVYLKWRELLGLPTQNPWIFWDGSGHGDFIKPLYDVKKGKAAEE